MNWTATEIAEYHQSRWSRDIKMLADWLIPGYHCDVARRAIFIPRSIQKHSAQPPPLAEMISLNYDRYQPGWTVGRTNVHCSCVNLSVSSLNPAILWFWWTDRGDELAECSSERTRSTRNAKLAGTCLRPSSIRCEAWRPRYLTNFLCFWLWNSLKIILRKGLYHITNTRFYQLTGCADGYCSRPSASRGTRLRDPPANTTSHMRWAYGSIY